MPMSPLISALGGLHPGYDPFAPGMTAGPGPPLPVPLPPPAPTLTPGLGGIGGGLAGIAGLIPPPQGRGAMLRAGAGLTPPPNFRLGNQQVQGGTLAEQYYPGGR
jgi:hypothetical protein